MEQNEKTQNKLNIIQNRIHRFCNKICLFSNIVPEQIRLSWNTFNNLRKKFKKKSEQNQFVPEYCSTKNLICNKMEKKLGTKYVCSRTLFQNNINNLWNNMKKNSEKIPFVLDYCCRTNLLICGIKLIKSWNIVNIVRNKIHLF